MGGFNEFGGIRPISAIKSQLQGWMDSRQARLILLATGLFLSASPIADASAEPPDGIPSPSIATSLPANGDPAGIRRWLNERGVTATLELLDGLEPAHTIAARCEAISAPLVKAASHWHTPLTSKVLGHTSTRIAHHSPCPVLVFPARLARSIGRD